MKRLFWILGIVFGILLVLPCLGAGGPIVVLAVGWILFPIHTVPKMTWEPTAVVVGATALVLLVGVTHWLAGWLYNHRNGSDEGDSPSLAETKIGTVPARRWRFRWSVSIVGIVVLLFACGICIIVTVHQIGWIARSDQPIMTMSGRETMRRIISSNQLKYIGLAAYNYGQKNQQLPPGGTFDQNGDMGHSWETSLLPYLEHDDIKPDMTLPWNHANNARHFKVVLREFINPGMRGSHEVDQEGYGLSHYAVNRHVMGPNYGVRLKDVTDGTSTTILAGEVNDHFQPWGHPVNWRDPALGINKSPDGFGAPWGSNGANIGFMDGSVRFLSDKIDPAIMRALSTPNGGEKIEDKDWE